MNDEQMKMVRVWVLPNAKWEWQFWRDIETEYFSRRHTVYYHTYGHMKMMQIKLEQKKTYEVHFHPLDYIAQKKNEKLTHWSDLDPLLVWCLWNYIKKLYFSAKLCYLWFSRKIFLYQFQKLTTIIGTSNFPFDLLLL